MNETSSVIINIPNWFMYVVSVVSCLYVYGQVKEAITQVGDAFNKDKK